MLARIRDWRQNFSWKLGYRQGQRRQQFRCPSWADRETFGLAYLQGKTGKRVITKEMLMRRNKQTTELDNFLNKLRGPDPKH